MIYYLFLFILIGATSGFLSGLLGIGGGLIVVPFLALIFSSYGITTHDMTMHVAEGSSLAAMIFTTFFSTRSHLRRGVKVWPFFKLLIVGLMLGTIVGAIIANFLHSSTLRIFFGVFLLILSARAFFHAKLNQSHHKFPNRLTANVIAFFIGILSGLLGIGGGAMLIPFLLYYDVSLRDTIGISSACAFMVSIVGTISFILIGLHSPDLPKWSIGYIYWPAVLVICIMSPLFVNLGVMLSHRLSVPVLRKIFAIFLLLTAVHLLV